MQLILLKHPPFFGSLSMERYAELIEHGMTRKGHEVQVWTCPLFFSRIKIAPHFKKWLGYLDQHVLGPLFLLNYLSGIPSDTVIILPDQALGTWVPVITKYPHVIHCHDLLALRSSKGEFPENPVGFTGRCYQAWIKNGFSRGKAFISISEATKRDLEKYFSNDVHVIETIYNPLNGHFWPMPKEEVIQWLGNEAKEAPGGVVLHVGADVWYKNRLGVLKIYLEYCKNEPNPLPLWLVGPQPSKELRAFCEQIPPNGQVRFISGVEHSKLVSIYCHAKVLLFPSLAEGFGWPILEAMACGTPVVTTDDAPMNEIGGDAAWYIPNMRNFRQSDWAHTAARILHKSIEESGPPREARINLGKQMSLKFNLEGTLDQFEKFYRSILFQWHADSAGLLKEP